MVDLQWSLYVAQLLQLHPGDVTLLTLDRLGLGKTPSHDLCEVNIETSAQYMDKLS